MATEAVSSAVRASADLRIAVVKAPSTWSSWSLGLLIGDLCHGEVFVAVNGNATATARTACLNLCNGCDLNEVIGNVHKIAACVGAEAHDFDANSHVLHGANRGRKVTVTRDDNGNVELWCEANKVNHEFNVKVCLEAAVAILSYILANNLVVVSSEEVVKCFLELHDIAHNLVPRHLETGDIESLRPGI